MKSHQDFTLRLLPPSNSKGESLDASWQSPSLLKDQLLWPVQVAS